MTTETTYKTFNVSESDAEQIYRVLDQFHPMHTNAILWNVKKRIKNINVNHYLFVGYLLGSISATLSMQEEITNNLQLCLRQN